MGFGKGLVKLMTSPGRFFNPRGVNQIRALERAGKIGAKPTEGTIRQFFQQKDLDKAIKAADKAFWTADKFDKAILRDGVVTVTGLGPGGRFSKRIEVTPELLSKMWERVNKTKAAAGKLIWETSGQPIVNVFPRVDLRDSFNQLSKSRARKALIAGLGLFGIPTAAITANEITGNAEDRLKAIQDATYKPGTRKSEDGEDAETTDTAKTRSDDHSVAGYGLGGALTGGALAAALSSDENRLRNVILSSVGGGTLGALSAALMNKYKA